MPILNRTKGRDWSVYQSGCDRSKDGKARAIQGKDIEPGIIVDIGSGTGIVEVLFSELFSKEELKGKAFAVGLEISKKMLKRANSRKEEYENISVTWVKSDITKPCIKEGSVNVVCSFSTLHEVYSRSGMEAVNKVLTYAHSILKPEGKLIIRAGAKPEDGEVYIKFNQRKFKKLFYKFARGFLPPSETHLRKGKYYKIDFEKLDDGMIRVSLPECFEFLVKYFYKENWKLEVKERWGILTPKQWEDTLKSIGFEIIDEDVHILPYFKDKYKKDGIELYKSNGGYEGVAYPHSHIILVAKKIET